MKSNVLICWCKYPPTHYYILSSKGFLCLFLSNKAIWIFIYPNCCWHFHATNSNTQGNFQCRVLQPSPQFFPFQMKSRCCDQQYLYILIFPEGRGFTEFAEMNGFNNDSMDKLNYTSLLFNTNTYGEVNLIIQQNQLKILNQDWTFPIQEANCPCVPFIISLQLLSLLQKAVLMSSSHLTNFFFHYIITGFYLFIYFTDSWHITQKQII